VGLCHDDTLIEREVVFQVQQSPKGLKAINVRAAD
jgi:hypothetical protein